MLSPLALIGILIVLNIPVYALLAWIMFDDLRENGKSVLLGLLKSAATDSCTVNQTLVCLGRTL